MVLVSTINVDLGAQTIVLTGSVGVDMVETLTFDNVAKTVTFAARSPTLINFQEFLAFADQVNIFETAILFNFSTINAAATQPFNQITSNELHDIGAGMWDLYVTDVSSNNIVSYEATKSSLKFFMNDRPADITLTFPEWILFLQSYNHYRLSIKGF